MEPMIYREAVEALAEELEESAETMRGLLPADVESNAPLTLDGAENDGMRMAYEECAAKVRKLLGKEG